MPTVRPLVDDDRDAVASLITAHFADGRSYEVPVDDESAGTAVRVAERGGTPVGVMALSTYASRAKLRDAMHLFETVDPVPEVATYGLVHAGYVHPDHTGSGIGSRLLNAIHRIGESNGVGLFVADAWFHGGPDSPARLLEKRGYETVLTRSIADRDGPCPKCGDRCVCEAALVVCAVGP